MQIHEDIRFQQLIDRMEALHIENCTEEMLLLLDELQTLSETEQDDIGLAASYFYRDILYEEKPGSPSYMQYVKRSLKIAETKNIPYYQMKANNTLGIVHSEVSDFHTSLDHYLCALHIAEEHPEYRYISVVLNNIGNLFVWLKDYADAAIYLEHAYYKSIVQNQDDRYTIDIIILNLIELYSNLENNEKVRQWKALSEAVEMQEIKELILCILLIHEAKQLVKTGHTDEAVKNIRKFITLCLGISDYIYIFRCCTNALKLAIEMVDFPLASNIMERLVQTQNDSDMTSFSYDYATIRVAYYQAFHKQLNTDCKSFYQEYYMQSQLHIKQLHNTYAQSLSVKITLEAIKDENKNVRQQNDILQRNIELDIFTNLYNKVSTEKYVRTAMQKRADNVIQGFLLIDIDLFKRINDNYGHGFGDQIITQVADFLNALDAGSKIAGRFGGDEFLVFLKQLSSVDEIKAVAESLLSQVRSCRLPDERIKEITLSIGICVIDSDMTFEQAFALADEALYRAKEHGRNQYVLNTTPFVD